MAELGPLCNCKATAMAPTFLTMFVLGSVENSSFEERPLDRENDQRYTSGA